MTGALQDRAARSMVAGGLSGTTVDRVLACLSVEGLEVAQKSEVFLDDDGRSLGRLGELASIRSIMCDVADELASATERFGPFASPHEGYAVLLEEVDELWSEIKADKVAGARGRMRGEALQVAAMACRFLLDVRPEVQA